MRLLSDIIRSGMSEPRLIIVCVCYYSRTFRLFILVFDLLFFTSCLFSLRPTILASWFFSSALISIYCNYSLYYLLLLQRFPCFLLYHNVVAPYITISIFILSCILLISSPFISLKISNGFDKWVVRFQKWSPPLYLIFVFWGIRWYIKSK